MLLDKITVLMEISCLVCFLKSPSQPYFLSLPVYLICSCIPSASSLNMPATSKLYVLSINKQIYRLLFVYLTTSLLYSTVLSLENLSLLMSYLPCSFEKTQLQRKLQDKQIYFKENLLSQFYCHYYCECH